MRYAKFPIVMMVLISLAAGAQRLPGNVVPEHYDLSFTPDLPNAAFTGEETIHVRILQPGGAITLNSAEIEMQRVRVTQGGKTQEAQVASDAAKAQVTFTVPVPLAAGPAEIRIEFSGILNGKLRGFYLAKTDKRRYAVTQFESTDARRAFPSFDEPAFKATFDVALAIDQGDTAISNGRIVSDTPGPGPGKHTLKFSTTPKMSTYLVAMAVGDFQCLEGAADDVPIRVCGTPDKKPLGQAALRYAEEVLKYYDQYYGIKYPFGKLDIVGAPDFDAGAMENTGAIFYRESLLFIDDANASIGARQTVFEILAHEMAHQWFGDLVTMKWWDNIWLNEGFATWMALKPSEALHPEWNAALGAVRATDAALTLDSLKNTHPIRAHADSPEEIGEMFDSISYQKGAAVLRMIESYVNPEVFRRGVNAYLRKFAYGNAAAEDFWEAITQASGRPVDQIMPTFVSQAGEPLVTVKAACVQAKPDASASARRGRRAARAAKPQPKTEVTISQERFSTGAGAGELWSIPICIKSDQSKPFCQIFGKREQTVPLEGCSSWIFANVNAVGYYRTRYDGGDLRKLGATAMSALSTAERLSLIRDAAALVAADKESVAGLLDLITALNQDRESTVVASYVRSLEAINHYLVTGQDRDSFHAWVRSTFRPMMQKTGWTSSPGETDDTHRLRARLIEILGEIGEDPETVQQAARLARQYLSDPGSVDASLADAILAVAAYHGDAALFDQYLEAMRQFHEPERFYNIAYAMANFRDPELVRRWLDRTVSPDIRNQDAPHFIASVLDAQPAPNAAWEWVKTRWTDVEKKITMASGTDIIGSTRSFCDAGSRDDVQKFFAGHKVPAADRVLRQTVEAIDSCINYRDYQQGNLAAWLGQHSGGSAGSR